MGSREGVPEKQAQQDRGVEQVDVAVEGDHEGVERREEQETDLDAVMGLEAEDLGATATAGDQHHRRPAEADQQPVRTGHVGDGVVGVLGIFCGLDGEVEIDGVLREHAHQGEHQERQRLGDVPFRQLRRPGENEGAAEDRQAGEQRDELALQADAAEGMGDHPGKRKSCGGEECPQVPHSPPASSSWRASEADAELSLEARAERIEVQGETLRALLLDHQ